MSSLLVASTLPLFSLRSKKTHHPNARAPTAVSKLLRHWESPGHGSVSSKHRCKISKVGYRQLTQAHPSSNPAIFSEIAHAVMDLLIVASQNPQANTSPTTPSSPSPHLSRSQHTHPAAHAPLPPIPYKTDQLIRLKIAMREREHPPRERESLAPGQVENEASLLGRNEGTVRFLFGPPGIADA